MLSFFPRGVLDEILNLIESVSEGFSTYSCIFEMKGLSFMIYTVCQTRKLFIKNTIARANKTVGKQKYKG